MAAETHGGIRYASHRQYLNALSQRRGFTNYAEVTRLRKATGGRVERGATKSAYGLLDRVGVRKYLQLQRWQKQARREGSGSKAGKKLWAFYEDSRDDDSDFWDDIVEYFYYHKD